MPPSDKGSTLKLWNWISAGGHLLEDIQHSLKDEGFAIGNFNAEVNNMSVFCDTSYLKGLAKVLGCYKY